MHHCYRTLLMLLLSGNVPQAIAQPTANLTAVRAVGVTEEPIRRTTTQPATVHPYYRAEIAARVSGYVQRVHADLGDQVKAGDLLAEIDAPELQQELAISEALVASAQAQVKRAEAKVRLVEAQLADAKAGVIEADSRIAAATANLATAEAELRRTQQLVDQRSVQQKLLDEAQGRRDEALANATAARAAVTKAKSQVGVAAAAVDAAKEEVNAAGASVKVAEARRKQAQVQLAFCRLVAPFAGVVTHRDVDPGDLVSATPQAHADPLFVVTQLARVRVRTRIPEPDTPLVDVGDAATLQLASPSLPSIQSQVSRLSKSLDPSTRTMLIEVEVDNPQQKLLPGMYGEATIVLRENPQALTLPASAVRFSESGESFVYLVDDQGMVSVVPVRLGADDGTKIEITSPLKPGQQVIDAHLQRFTDGQQVRVLN